MGGLHQGVGAVGGDGGDAEHRPLPAQAAHDLLGLRLALLGGEQVELVEHQPARQLGQRRGELAQLVDDRLGGLHRVGLIEGRHVHHVEEQPGAGQVLEEAQPQAGALGGPLDQPRHVGHHEVLVHAELHHAQVGHQGGEGVVGDLGLGGGNGANQRRLAGVGHAQQAHVGHHLHLQAQVAALTLGARRGPPRRAVGGGLEVDVA